MRHPDAFADLERSLREGPVPRSIGFDRSPRGERHAAVLMLFTDDTDPELTFVTRAETLRKHPGQMALPGGRVDPGDTSRAHTALREANEEIGLAADAVSVLGELPPLWVPASRFDVTTVLGVWEGGAPLEPVDPAETGAVHCYRISDLASEAVRVTASHPTGFLSPAFVFGDQFIWGLTAHLVDWVLELGGWARPWDADRIVEIPARYLRD